MQKSNNWSPLEGGEWEGFHPTCQFSQAALGQRGLGRLLNACWDVLPSPQLLHLHNGIPGPGQGGLPSGERPWQGSTIRHSREVRNAVTSCQFYFVVFSVTQ
jgi:hypothetical protein